MSEIEGTTRVVRLSAPTTGSDGVTRYMCCLCFDRFTIEELSVDPSGAKQDTCVPCEVRDRQSALAGLHSLRDECAALRAENEDLREALAQSVPLSAIEAALDGLYQTDPPMLDPLDRERRDTLADVRRALLGPSENGDTE